MDLQLAGPRRLREGALIRGIYRCRKAASRDRNHHDRPNLQPVCRSEAGQLTRDFRSPTLSLRSHNIGHLCESDITLLNTLLLACLVMLPRVEPQDARAAGSSGRG